MSLTYRQLLVGNPNFRNLFAGQVVSELGNWFNFIAALGLVRVVSGAAPDAATIILIARTAPFSLCALFAGAIVLRWSRKTVLIATDLLRAVVALGFLLVHKPEDLWIAYFCTALLAALTAFFEAAKNAALPNVTGANGLLAGNALMFSSRFLLMSVGAALGGSASAAFGYEIAFVINAASFVASAISIWLIPDRAMYDEQSQNLLEQTGQISVFADIRDGWSFIKNEPLVLTIILMNTIWAIGGGALNLVAERLGGVVFAGANGLSADAAVAVLYAAAGAGLFIGMMIARETDLFVRRHNLLVPFIGWMLVLQGVLYAVAGLMPNLWLAAILMCISRVLLGVEYAIQETILIRQIPDRLRGRVMTTDRAVELSVFTVSAGFAGWSLYFITPQMLAVWSGLLSSAAGVFWFAQIRRGRPDAVTVNAKPPDEPAVLATN